MNDLQTVRMNKRLAQIIGILQDLAGVALTTQGDLDPTDLTQALRNLRDGGLIPESPHPAYGLLDATLDHIEDIEAQASRFEARLNCLNKANKQLEHKNMKLCDRIKGYEADLDGSTRMITAFRKAFKEVSSTVDNVMPNGGLGDVPAASVSRSDDDEFVFDDFNPF